MDSLFLLIIIIVIALVYDFFNGFNDAANAIATTVSTRALSLRTAIIVAFIGNFAGAISHTAVAYTIGKGVINPDMVDLTVVLAALIGATAWTAIASFLGIPISVTHALVGALLGAGIVFVGFGVIVWSGMIKIIIAMVLSPIAGFTVGYFLFVGVGWIFRHSHPSKINKRAKHIQILSAAWMSFSHGMNDAQNAMGIITLALLSYGAIAVFHVPLWVMAAAALAMGLGTAAGGWKVIKTMGQKVFKLKPIHALTAEVSASGVISTMSLIGAPISTTHVIASSIMGVGASNHLTSVRWKTVKNIVTTWIITIPGAGLIAALAMVIINLF
ncbi:inorganic phosphate transporter [Patescibacteria group bacterium]|nr:inorganic phosphate transporter [Patescibacteria group bacterium]MBU0964267.1 inorganic phosphate transporter [Patescibacteria group bacterium]